jgi:hypothetical protein
MTTRVIRKVYPHVSSKRKKGDKGLAQRGEKNELFESYDTISYIFSQLNDKILYIDVGYHVV